VDGLSSQTVEVIHIVGGGAQDTSAFEPGHSKEAA
jgi:hypothetical protein